MANGAHQFWTRGITICFGPPLAEELALLSPASEGLVGFKEPRPRFVLRTVLKLTATRRKVYTPWRFRNHDLHCSFVRNTGSVFHRHSRSQENTDDRCPFLLFKVCPANHLCEVSRAVNNSCRQLSYPAFLERRDSRKASNEIMEPQFHDSHGPV
jgi:hypothetical protein